MDQTVLNTIRQKLTDRKRELEEQLKEVSASGPTNTGEVSASFPDYGSDEDENSAEVETFTTNLSLEKVLTSSLRDVEGALDRIEKGTYGICKYCGKPIDERRLLARPASSACIDCKEKMKSRDA